MSRIIVMLFTLIAAFSLPVSAHHGWSEYDASCELKLTGTIAESGYEHPHGPSSWFTVVGYANRSKTEEMRAERIIVGAKTVELR